jgi:hypothetical protein
MTWLDTSQYNPNDLCSICLEKIGTTQAIYQTPCKHNFHNDCLYNYCESPYGKSVGGNIHCPVCRRYLGYETCTDVDAFKDKVLSDYSGPLFDGNAHILEIYNNQNNLRQGGRKHKKCKKTTRKRRKTNKRRRKTSKIKTY